MVSSSFSRIYIRCSAASTQTATALLNSPLLLFYKPHIIWDVRCPILHKSLPNGTFGNAFVLDGLWGLEYLFGTELRLSAEGLLGKDRSPQTDIFVLPHFTTPRAPGSCGAEHLCQSANINLKKQNKKREKPEKKICQMPLAHTRCRDTDEFITRTVTEND